MSCTLHLSWMILVIVAACSPAKEDKHAIITFENQLNSPQDVRLLQYDMISLEEMSFDSLAIDEELNRWTLQVSQAVMTNLRVNDTLYLPLYLQPGSDLVISGNLASPDSIVFSGDDSEINTGILEVYKLFKRFEKPYFFRLELDEYLARTDTLNYEMVKLMDEIREEGNQMFVQKFFDSWIDMERLNYVLGHYDLYSGQVPEALQAYADQIYDPQLVSLGSFIHGVALHMYMDAVVYPETWGSNWTEAERRTVAPIILRDSIEAAPIDESFKQHILALHVYKYLAADGISNATEQLYRDYAERYSHPRYLPTLQRKYSELTVLRPGNQLPNLMASTVSGDTVSVKDLFDGQVAYIDLWATWCGPCLQEFPYSAALQKEYDEEVIFLYLSIDSDAEKWNEFVVKNNELAGMHLLSTNASEARRQLQNRGIPRYILIDKGGLIVDAWAPSPGTNEIRELIDQLL